MTRLQAKEEPKLFFMNNPCPLFIDEVQKENGILYPVEIKVTGNPRASMTGTNTVLDRIPEKKRGMGAFPMVLS
jgi:hypothetical protein